MEWIAEKIVGPLLLFLIVGLVVVLIVGGYNEIYSEKITLTKNDWVCSELKTVRRTHLIPAGKALVPITSNDDVCVIWSKK